MEALDRSESESGLALLEHINVNVGDLAATGRFFTALGCQTAVIPIHFNCGPHTQFHCPVEQPVQVWRGIITIAYTSAGLQRVRERLAALGDVELQLDGEATVLRDPRGNSFRLRLGTEQEHAMAALPSKRPNTDETLREGVLGIVELSLPAAPGTAARLVKWYEKVFSFHSSVEEGCASLVGGPLPASQRIHFVEQADVPPYTGDHFCFYIRYFEDTFTKCMARQLLYVNPRFTFLDDSRNLEQAKHWQAFRILEVKDDEDQVLLHEEHEIRSLSHQFLSITFGS